MIIFENDTKKKQNKIKMAMNIFYLTLIYILMIIFDNKYENKDLIFEIKRQKAIKEELYCKFIRINRFNSFNSEIAYIQKFIIDFKNNEIKELNHTIVNKLKLF